MSLYFKGVKKAVELIVSSGNVPNIIGLQGIGKSDLVREFAREKGYGFFEVTCSLMQEGDLAMPYISKKADGSQEVSYAINNIILNVIESSKTHEMVILFLDEFNRASAQVQSELMNLVLQREVVGIRLPENVRLVLAMNPSSDMEGFDGTSYSVNFSDSAMMGRVVSITMEANLSDWLEYAERKVDSIQVVHPDVIGFLRSNPKLFSTVEEYGRINNTPRGWKRASDIYYKFVDSEDIPLNLLQEVLTGTLEKSSVLLFIKYIKDITKGIDYVALAKSVLENDTDGWDDKLFDMNDLGLTKVFSILCDSVDVTNKDMVKRFKDYFKAVGYELAYSWYLTISSKYPNLYDVLSEMDDFAGFIMSIIEKNEYSAGNGNTGIMAKN